MEPKQITGIAKSINVGLVILGILISILGLSLLTASNKSGIEYLLMFLFLLSGSLLCYGGITFILKTKVKEKQVIEYEKQIQVELQDYRSKNELSNSSDISSKLDHSVASEHLAFENEKLLNDDTSVLASWQYTKEEWLLMRRHETIRRLKEGLWVTALVALLGGWLISSSREATFFTGALISFGVGLLVSVLKISISNSIFKVELNNTIIIAKQGLLINNRLKIIRDDTFQLQYVNHLNIAEHDFLEFSLQWQTRQGKTNDQFRIYVPKQYLSEINSILSYFNSLAK